MKRTSIIILVIIMVLIQINPALGGQWVKADTSNSKVWVDTSHWENHRYQAWVDTSHWEYGPYRVWVSSGYWNYWSYWDGWYWVGDYVPTTNIIYGDDALVGYGGGYIYYNYNGDFARKVRYSGDQRVEQYRWDSVRNTNMANGQAIGYRSSKEISIFMDFTWDAGAPRQINRYWNLYLHTTDTWFKHTYLRAYSYGYYRRDLIRGATWIDTSHWETWWGWLWINSGYWEWRDNWVWVTSGYWDEAHGQVSVGKSPTYVFTSFHKTENGEPSHMDIHLNWNLNKAVTEIRVYHELVRYRNKGLITVDGKIESAAGMGTKNGQATYRLEYPKPGANESKLYIQFTFANKTGVRMWANVPVNGFDSTLQDKSVQPVWNKSLLDEEIINF